MLLAAAAFVLTVRVYDVYGLPPADRQVMLSLASTALAEAGVEAAWIDCNGPRPAAACQLSVSENELVLRILRQSPDDSHALGVAFVHSGSEPNTVATVYARHVADMARRAATPMTTLLGRVAAHELGHLLLGANAHSPSGLMRASWTWLQIQRAHPEDWRFAAADVALIRQRLERRQLVAAGEVAETTRIATTVMSSARPLAPARSSSAGGTSER
jgi:hypothetical protein